MSSWTRSTSLLFCGYPRSPSLKWKNIQLISNNVNYHQDGVVWKDMKGQTCQKPATTTTSLAWHFALEIPRILTGQGHLSLRITVRRKQVTASSGAIDSTTFLDCYRCICYVCMWHVGENPLMSLMHNGRLGACHTDLASNRRARQWPAPVCLQQEALCGLLLLQLLKLTCLNLKLDSGKDSCLEPRLTGGD